MSGTSSRRSRKRRHVQVDDAQAVEEILTELPGGHALGQVAIGRCDDTDVGNRRGLVRTDRLDFTGLEEPEQERLHPQAHFTHFVEEQRAAMRELQLARLVAIGAREAALDVTEQLRLEQRLGQTRAVHRDEGAPRAARSHVDGAGDEVLADPAFAGDQDLRFADRGAACHRQHFHHRRASCYNYRLAAGQIFGRSPFRHVQHDWAPVWPRRAGSRAGRGLTHLLARVEPAGQIG